MEGHYDLTIRFLNLIKGNDVVKQDGPHKLKHVLQRYVEKQFVF